MSDVKIAFIGAGAMGLAMLRGSLSGGLPADSVHVGVRSPDQIQSLMKDLGLNTAHSVTDAATEADIAVLALPAAAITSVLSDIGNLLRDDAVVVSLADGVDLASLEKNLPKGVGAVRAMPSFSAQVSAGLSLLAAGSSSSPSQRQKANDLLSRSGAVMEVEEHQIDDIAPLSSGGPGYLLYVAEAMIEAGAIRGVPRDKARWILAEVLTGTAALINETETSLSDLRASICAPGGGGVRRVAQLDKNGVRGAFLDALGGDI